MRLLIIASFAAAALCSQTATAGAAAMSATASLVVGGSGTLQTLCRQSPDQETTARQEFSKKNQCTHAACTSLKSTAATKLRNRLEQQHEKTYKECTKYVKTNDSCRYFDCP